MDYLFLIIVLLVIVGVLVIAGATGIHLDDYHYDRLKWVVERGHYVVVFVGVLAKTFDFPYGTETVTVVAALFAMLAGLLGISSKNYYAAKSTHEMTDEEVYDALNELEEEGDEDD